MAGRVDNASQKAAIAKVAEVGTHADTIRRQLGLVLESGAFRGSRRSQRFLAYIIEHALDGRFDQLKERTIGIELFGREPSYDTGEDSIVRVTASDVRRRLVEYYADGGAAAPIRMELPPGSYIPEFHIVSLDDPARPDAAAPPTAHPAGKPSHLRTWIPYLSTAAALCLCLWLWVENASLRHDARTRAQTAPRVLPWSALFQPDRRVTVVLSDTNFGAIQDVLAQNLPLSEYANRQYPPSLSALSPDLSRVVQLLSRNQFTSTADAGISVLLSDLARRYSHTLSVRSARNFQVRDFKSGDNFILIGSARVNPWVTLFDDTLGFSIDFDTSLKRQVIRNRKPASGESPEYVPTAVTGGTGQAYGMFAFVANPGQIGHALLLAGTSMEGTEAAAEFVLNPDRLAAALSRAGIDPAGAVRHFEGLIKLNSMAGAPNAFELTTLHPLPDSVAR